MDVTNNGIKENRRNGDLLVNQSLLDHEVLPHIVEHVNERGPLSNHERGLVEDLPLVVPEVVHIGHVELAKDVTDRVQPNTGVGIGVVALDLASNTPLLEFRYCQSPLQIRKVVLVTAGDVISGFVECSVVRVLVSTYGHVRLYIVGGLSFQEQAPGIGLEFRGLQIDLVK